MVEFTRFYSFLSKKGYFLNEQCSKNGQKCKMNVNLRDIWRILENPGESPLESLGDAHQFPKNTGQMIIFIFMGKFTHILNNFKNMCKFTQFFQN